ncbi:MAG TPA: hypothetical protein VEJ18_11525, partial [Planctomycetota bacterium]|nr:hypothetical protein [Planctomycetota bacterium]
MLTPLVLLALQSSYQDGFETRVSLDRFADGWERVTGPGYPGWNEAARVELAPGGGYALRLRTLGSAVAVRRAAAQAWAVDPARPWRLTARVKLSGLRRNAATAALRWLDRRGELVREDVSAPVTAEGAWAPLVLDVPFPPGDAATAQVVLRYGGPDVRGEALFDDVRLEPSTLLRLEPAGGGAAVFPSGARPRMRVTAFGLGAGDHVLLLRGVAAMGPLPIAPGTPLSVELPALAPGCHELRAAVEGGDGLSATAVETIAVLPADEPPGRRRWIGATFNPFTSEIPDPAALVRLGG